MLIKISGLTPKGYIRSKLNLFDCLITIIGVIDIGILFTILSDKSLYS